MPKGEYKENPAESMRECRYCDAIMHHMGVGTHESFCRKRSPQEREDYLATKGKYNYRKRNGKRATIKTKLPVIITQMESAHSERKSPEKFPAPHLSVIEGDRRISMNVSLDMDALLNLLKTLRIGK